MWLKVWFCGTWDSKRRVDSQLGLKFQPLPLLVSDFHLDLLPLDDLVQGHNGRKAERPDQPDVQRGRRKLVELQPEDEARVDELEFEEDSLIDASAKMYNSRPIEKKVTYHPPFTIYHLPLSNNHLRLTTLHVSRSTEHNPFTSCHKPLRPLSPNHWAHRVE